jgi:hypothetical protein
MVKTARSIFGLLAFIALIIIVVLTSPPKTISAYSRESGD